MQIHLIKPKGMSPSLDFIMKDIWQYMVSSGDFRRIHRLQFTYIDGTEVIPL